MPISPVPPSGKNQKSRFPGLSLDEKNMSEIVTGSETRETMKITPKTCISDLNNGFILTLSADFRDNQT